ncbi:protein PAL OF QUIRKY-like [Cornus florida]|uniref:protein PAL OF QUIRKY-like n=1 Tax=Cornus florida TaxID=4283 RepID=UPI00289AE333|nr:protein PAL OF QUIRKY-like [Cornus florida]
MTGTLNSNNTTTKIKFLYSYGGKLLPRQTDLKLRYVGGHTRVLAIHRSITFAELMVKFGELCGSSVSLKCKLPEEDLDVLVSITCDEDLASLIEEYDQFSSFTHQDLKIRAILFPINALKTISPPPSTVSSFEPSASRSPPYAVAGSYLVPTHASAYRSGGRSFSPAVAFPSGFRKDAGKVRRCPSCERENPRNYLFP